MPAKIFIMKTTVISLITAAVLTLTSFIQQQDPWKKEQIISTKDLAAKIQNNSKDLPVIINVGPMENIKTAIKVGNADSDEGIKKLTTTVSGMKKTSKMVIYCGCCSYANCPNIRPAFNKLQEL